MVEMMAAVWEGLMKRKTGSAACYAVPKKVQLRRSKQISVPPSSCCLASVVSQVRFSR